MKSCCIREQWKFRSACAFARSEQNLRSPCPQSLSMDLEVYFAKCRGSSDRTEVHTDLLFCLNKGPHPLLLKHHKCIFVSGVHFQGEQPRHFQYWFPILIRINLDKREEIIPLETIPFDIKKNTLWNDYVIRTSKRKSKKLFAFVKWH